MKKIRIPFSLDEYNKGIYEVETRGDGKSKPKKARILCTDLNNLPWRSIVAALCLTDEQEIIKVFYPDGKYSNSSSGDELDLYLTKQEFEDGDIVIRDGDNVFGSFILPYRGTNEEGLILTEAYFYYFPYSLNIKKGIECGCGYTKDYRLATEEEKKKFFDALKKEGKRWNAETKQVEDIEDKYFKPKDWCLMRIASDYAWCLCQFSNMDSESYVAIGGAMHEYCIPYNDETKYLLGTTEDAPEKYKTW